MFDRIYQLDPLILVLGFWRLLIIGSIYLIDITYLGCYFILCDWVYFSNCWSILSKSSNLCSGVVNTISSLSSCLWDPDDVVSSLLYSSSLCFLFFSVYLTHGLPSSVQFSCSVMSSSLWSHRLQHARLPCPSPTPRVCSNSCP